MPPQENLQHLIPPFCYSFLPPQGKENSSRGFANGIMRKFPYPARRKKNATKANQLVINDFLLVDFSQWSFQTHLLAL
jgi:hypothetical protein